MDGQPAAAVKIRLVIKLLENLGIKHADDKVVGFIGIRYDAEQRSFRFPVAVHARSQFCQFQVIP